MTVAVEAQMRMHAKRDGKRRQGAGYGRKRHEFDVEEISATRRGGRHGHVPFSRALERHFVREAAVLRHHIGVSDGEQPLQSILRARKSGPHRRLPASLNANPDCSNVDRQRATTSGTRSSWYSPTNCATDRTMSRPPSTMSASAPSASIFTTPAVPPARATTVRRSTIAHSADGPVTSDAWGYPVAMMLAALPHRSRTPGARPTASGYACTRLSR